MARNLPVGQIGNYMGEQLEQLLRITVFESDRRLKEGSPVDTGRLRLAWAISEQGTPGYDPGPQSAVGGVAPPRRLDYQVERLGNVYHIHNNLPYAEPVIFGNNLPSSWNGRWRSVSHYMRDGKPFTGPPPQIIKGYPDLVAREMQNFVDQNWRRIRSQG